MSMSFPKRHPYYAEHLQSVKKARREGRANILAMLEEDIEPIVVQYQKEWQRIRSACKADLTKLIGLQLKTERMDQWAAILADPTEPGRFRAQYFTRSGFVGHSTYDSLEKVLFELMNENFTQLADGAMETLSTTQEWADGMFYTDLVRQIGCGMLSHAEADRQYEAYRRRKAS